MPGFSFWILARQRHYVAQPCCLIFSLIALSSRHFHAVPPSTMATASASAVVRPDIDLDSHVMSRTSAATSWAPHFQSQQPAMTSSDVTKSEENGKALRSRDLQRSATAPPILDTSRTSTAATAAAMGGGEHLQNKSRTAVHIMSLYLLV